MKLLLDCHTVIKPLSNPYSKASVPVAIIETVPSFTPQSDGFVERTSVKTGAAGFTKVAGG